MATASELPWRRVMVSSLGESALRMAAWRAFNYRRRRVKRVVAPFAFRAGRGERTDGHGDPAPSLHVDYKHSWIKQYHKEGRALHTETVSNDAYDFGSQLLGASRRNRLRGQPGVYWTSSASASRSSCPVSIQWLDRPPAPPLTRQLPKPCLSSILVSQFTVVSNRRRIMPSERRPSRWRAPMDAHHLGFRCLFGGGVRHVAADGR